MKRRNRNIIVWGLLVIYLIIATSLMTHQTGSTLCNSINIIIHDSTTNSFVRHTDVITILEENFNRVVGEPIKNINTFEIEQLMENVGVIKSCNAYTTLDGKLNIEIQQRTPIVRIINGKGQSYYLDLEGYVIHRSRHFTPHVLVMNGNIKSYFTPGRDHNILNDSIKEKKLRDYYSLAKIIYEDEFWRAQVEQLYVKKNNEVDLIPRVGAHLIEFGKPDDCEKKLRKLKVFYTEGLNKIGWNQYEIINISYKDQIVCTKR